MNTQPNTPASRNEEAVLDGGQTVTALRWCAATLQAVARKHAAESDLISMVDTNEQKSVGEVLDMADAALAAPGAAIDAREQIKAVVLTSGTIYEIVKSTRLVSNGSAIEISNRLSAALASRQEAPVASGEPTDAQITDVIQIVRNIFGGQSGSSNAAHWEDMNARARKSIREALSPATVAPPVEWGDPKTVGMFVRQLQTIAPETPIHAAVHTDLDGKRVALTKPVTISRERVQGRRIRQGDQSVPYSIVVWASHDEAAQPCASQGCGGAVSEGDEYFLQDTRSYVGNCPMWWAAGGNGYTSRVDKAQRYSREQAICMCNSRGSDVPWACAEILPLQRPTIDVQELPRSIEKQRAALSTAPRSLDGATPGGNDHG